MCWRYRLTDVTVYAEDQTSQLTCFSATISSMFGSAPDAVERVVIRRNRNAAKRLFSEARIAVLDASRIAVFRP
jgi:hypothetical protein